jgi:hypothetical protein
MDKAWQFLLIALVLSSLIIGLSLFFFGTFQESLESLDRCNARNLTGCGK